MFSVYALGDPRTNKVHYIGIAKDVYKRYIQHLNNPYINSAKNDWMNEIKHRGLVPTLTILESNVDEKEIFDRENFWIQHYLNQGAPLTNIVGVSFSSTEKWILPPREYHERSTSTKFPKKSIHIELRVREVAIAKGVSQRKLSICTGMDVKTIQRIYRDPTCVVTTETLAKLANILQVDASELIESVEDE
jgi:DNA-binding Xre family transcriptional regulator